MKKVIKYSEFVQEPLSDDIIEIETQEGEKLEGSGK
jgi:hypothetical protein